LISLEKYTLNFYSIFVVEIVLVDFLLWTLFDHSPDFQSAKRNSIYQNTIILNAIILFFFRKCLNDEKQKISVSAEKSARSAILAAREIASSPSNYMAHEKLSYAFSVWRMEGDWNSTT